MDETTPGPETPLDPAAITDVYIVMMQCMQTAAGTFSIKAYDGLGRELADAPLVPDARDWAEALEFFWRDVGKTARTHNSAPFN